MYPFNKFAPAIASSSLSERCHDTISEMVCAFAVQDIDVIMGLFAEDATYCDIRGDGQSGGEYHGKAAIRKAFVRQFHLAGTHSYELPTIVANGQTVFASWTLVLGNAHDPAAARFDGVDQFALDGDARVILKKAWLKGQPRLARKVMARNPLVALRHSVYAFFSG